MDDCHGMRYNLECAMPKMSQEEFRKLLLKNLPQNKALSKVMSIINDAGNNIKEFSFAGRGWFGENGNLDAHTKSTRYKYKIVHAGGTLLYNIQDDIKCLDN